MKPLKLSVTLAMSFASILVVSGYIGNTGKNADSKLFPASQAESQKSDHSKRIYIASCADPMDDLCADYKPHEKEIREAIVGTGIFV